MSFKMSNYSFKVSLVYHIAGPLGDLSTDVKCSPQYLLHRNQFFSYHNAFCNLVQTNICEVRLSPPGPSLFLTQDLSHCDVTPRDSMTQKPQAASHMDVFLCVVQLFFCFVFFFKLG